MARVTVTRPELYESDGTPVMGGPRDPHFGAIEPGEACPVCGNRRDNCPGHFGKIDLARPVLIPYYSDHVNAVLQATCRSCSRILLPDEQVKRMLRVLRTLKARWPQLASNFIREIRKQAAQNSVCPHCGARQYRIRYIRPVVFYEERPEGEVRLTPIEIRDRLEKVRNEDAELLGLDPEASRPEWMVATVLPVPPLAVRPPITLETGLKSEDDLTHALVEIIRQNERLKHYLATSAPETMVEDSWIALQHMIAAYIDNELPNVFVLQHRGGRPLKTLAQRLKGKEGRLRGNLSGKRVNYSARTVISPDPEISINEVGVPIEIAMILTYPLRVTPENIEEARKYVLNGPYKWPGATYVIKARTGTKIDLRYHRNHKQLAESLEVGDIVERHLLDGDIVLFNRQPSLHRMSILAHRVRVMKGKTFRLNPLVCPPYNADFDGDEMNLHVPRIEEAVAEAEEILLVEKNIKTPRYGGPIIGGRQDYISGAYLMTVKTRLLTEEEVLELLSKAGYKGDLPEPAILHPKPLWTGKQIVSLFLPEDFSYEGRAKINAGPLACDNYDCFNDSYIVIRNGKLLEGVFDKNAIGAEQPNNVLHIIALEYGDAKARELLDTLYRSFIRMLEVRGLTLSLSDVDIPQKARDEIAKLTEEAKNEIAQMIKEFHEGKLEPIPGRTMEESLEIKIINRLQELFRKSQEVAVNYMDPFNDVFIMARTGARGSETNIAQMVAMLGQQVVRGKRIHRGFRKRTLAHFVEDDLSPEAKGFVKGNFRYGLRPTEVFFHAAAGREGLVDTAVKTSQSGYMQRRLINALNDLVVLHDGTVRDAYGNLIQIKYGEDGVDPMKTYHGDPIDVDRLIEKYSHVR
ncbi:MAG: DNA-directed RNA polymerase subunit A' [Desulfurococcales archaeon]|nr:DNA-directed RNA polymerase subunit A' [Desulfurococcales archaeon]MCE4629819.1 DNA-directed RNA polymerase subunit A' [Desulfurococcales archaeon]